MARRTTPFLVAALLAGLPAAAAAWTLDLPERATVSAGNVRVADLARGDVPAAAGRVVVVAGTRPGRELEIDRRTILRRLVMAGLADGVSLSGAETCHVAVTGRSVPPSELERRIRALLAPHLPTASPGAPATWLELDLAGTAFVTDGDWSVTWPDAGPLAPGRNLLAVRLETPHGNRRLSVAATVHAFARTPRVVTPLARGQAVEPDMLGWVWTDLAAAPGHVITDSLAVSGMVLERDLAPGQPLTRRDLEPRPLVRRGEQVDLVVRRGRVAAVVRAECRQDGRRGQMVSVLNPLTKRLVLANVTAPGVVTLGR